MSNITPNTSYAPNSGLNIQQLKQSQIFGNNEYNDILQANKGALTEAYGQDVNSIFLVANSKLMPNEVQQDILSLFQEKLNFIEQNIDPSRLNFNVTRAMDNEICINRTATSGGRVKLIINDDGVIALSFLPDKSNPKESELFFFSRETADFEMLAFRFFSF